MPQPKTIVVVGSYNVSRTIRVERLPAPGETVMGTAYSEGPGGKGSNQAVAAKRLGGQVEFVGCVGTDGAGDEAVSLWEREEVRAGEVRRVETHTGVALIFVEPSGANAIAVDSGANLELAPEDLEQARPALGRDSILLTQLEIGIRTASAACDLARKAGAITILNPAPARPAKELDLASVDIITPNEREFLTLTGTDDLEEGAAMLRSRGPRTVIVTLGARGAYVSTDEGSYREPAPRVEAVDETGAGDAFNGALAVALAEGVPLREAVRFANLAGAMTVTKGEVISSLPMRKELERFAGGARR